MATITQRFTYVEQDVNFAASTIGTEVLSLEGRVPMAIITPASLGATAITFQSAIAADGTFYPVLKDDGTALTVTVSSTVAGWYDITSIFPASVQYIKIVSGTSITNSLKLISRDV